MRYQARSNTPRRTGHMIRGNDTSFIRIGIWLGGIGAAALLVACSMFTSADNTTQQTTPLPSSAIILFPQQAPADNPRFYPDARFVGQLVVVDTCLRIDSGDGHPSILPVWPHTFTLSSKNELVSILNETGGVIARVGDTVELRGGSIPEDEHAWLTTDMLRQKPPQACDGPYWLAADDVKVVP